MPVGLQRRDGRMPLPDPCHHNGFGRSGSLLDSVLLGIVGYGRRLKDGGVRGDRRRVARRRG